MAEREIHLKRTGLYASGCSPVNMIQAVFYNEDMLVYDLEDSVPASEKDAARILETIGVHVPDTCRLAICEVPADHPFVLVEQMMPVLPIVRCQSFEQAVEDAVVAEHGNRHTASIFSKDVDHMTRFARVIETTIYVKNSATKAGVGIGGEGHCTMTIAGPTGEGITCAKSFCRRRRCMLAEGGLRII